MIGFDLLGADAARVLKQGMKGADVVAVQKALAAAGFSPKGGADGDFGENTKKAVIAFQKAKGLSVDGKVGPETIAALGLSPVDVLLPPKVIAAAQAEAVVKAEIAKTQAAQATTPVQVQQAVATLQTAVAQVPTDVSSALQAKVVEVKAQAEKATTPAEVKEVKEKIAEIAQEVETVARGEGGILGFLKRERWGFPTWAWGALGGGVATIIRFLARRKT